MSASTSISRCTLLALTLSACSAQAAVDRDYAEAVECAVVTGTGAALLTNINKAEFTKLADGYELIKAKADRLGADLGKSSRDVAADREEKARAFLTETVQADPATQMREHRERANACVKGLAEV